MCDNSDAYNEQLRCVFVPSALGDSFGSLTDLFSKLIGEYAAIEYTSLSAAQALWSGGGGGGGGGGDLSLSLSDEQVIGLQEDLTRIRYETTKICFKISDGQMIAAMQCTIDFGSYLETRTRSPLVV